MNGIQVETNGNVATYTQDKIVLVGRGEDANFKIDDKTVSRHHGELRFDETLDAWIYNDLKSANGTFAGPMRITTVEVVFPMELRLGNEPSAPVIRITKYLAAMPKIEPVVDLTLLPSPKIEPVPNPDVCPKCGEPRKNRFCVNCGHEFQEVPTPSVNHCGNCGALSSGTAFCTSCGKAQ